MIGLDAEIIRDAATPNGVGFDINIDADPRRRDAWLWGSGRLGADLLSNGIFVLLNKIPTDDSGWATAPYEPQYLELFDVTSSP